MYDLKAIKYGDDNKHARRVGGVYFIWRYTPEGDKYWFDQYKGLTDDGKAKLAAMRDQYEREKRPAVGVLHMHDGSSKSPVHVGADVQTWGSMYNIGFREIEGDDECWTGVRQYLIHSYPEPEPKRIAGTVAEYTDTPDFTTWVADDE